jgi:hypothetical protein
MVGAGEEGMGGGGGYRRGDDEAEKVGAVWSVSPEVGPCTGGSSAIGRLVLLDFEAARIVTRCGEDGL